MNKFLAQRNRGAPVFSWSVFLAVCISLSGTASAWADPGQDTVPSELSRYLRTIGTIEYSGLQTQARIQSTSLVRSVRRIYGNTAAYDMSLEGALQVGNDSEVVDFKSDSFRMQRNLSSGEMTSSQPGCRLSLLIVNEVVRRVSLTQVQPGVCDLSVPLDLGECFPQTLTLRVASQPLGQVGFPPDTLLIAVESGMLNFQVRFIGPVYSRYKALLVYSPSQDLTYQSAASFVALNGEEKVRIENYHYISNELGNKPLVPLVDAQSYIDLASQPLPVRNQGSLPMWAVQAVRVYDVIHTASTAAAERTTNDSSISTVGGSLWREIVSTAHWLGREVGPQAARDFLNFFKQMDEQFARWWADLARNRQELSNLILDTTGKALTLSTGVLFLPMHTAFLINAAALPVTIWYLQGQFALIQRNIADMMRVTPKPVPPQPKPVTPTPEPEEPTKDSGKKSDMALIIPLAAIGIGGLIAIATKLGGKTGKCCKIGERACNGHEIGLNAWYCCPEDSPYLGADGFCYSLTSGWGKSKILCRPGRCAD